MKREWKDIVFVGTMLVGLGYLIVALGILIYTLWNL